MLDFINIYENMENTINDDILYDLVKVYSKEENIHQFLINKNNKKPSTIQNHYDELYTFLFYIWRRSILKLTDNDIKKLVKENIVKDDYLKLRDILSSTHHINSNEEYEELIKKEPLINKYGWHNSGKDSSWNYISAASLFAWQDYNPHPIEHKLCLNCDNQCIEEIVYHITYECHLRNLPFYIKYDKTGTRDDSIVIYSNTKNLDEYIGVLRKTRLYNKGLFKHVHEAPLLTGKIEDWLGYASETKDYNKMSFSEVRANIIRFSIKNALINWVYENKGLKINSGNTEVYFDYYLSRCLAAVVINRYKEDYKELKNKDLFFEYYGITIQEVCSNEFKEKLIDLLKHKMSSIINSRYNHELFPNITINTSNYKKIVVTEVDYKNTVKQISPQIFKNCPSFTTEIKKQLEHYCKINDVDINKFCFDNKRRDALFSYQKRVLSKKK